MRRRVRLRASSSLFLALVLLSPVAGAGDFIEITSATRQLQAWAYGYDYDFDGGTSDDALSDATTGAFADNALADLFDWYGAHIGTGSGSITSLIAGDSIEVAYDVVGDVDNASIFTADAGAEGHIAVTFTADALVRVAVDGTIARIGEAYAVGDAVVRDGAGAVIVAAYVQANPTTTLDTVRWLPAGAYELEASVQAWAFGGSGAVETARGTLELNLTFHDAADMDLDEAVDTDDLGLYLTLFDEADDRADVHGDGVVDADDRAAYWSAWRAATLGCPGDLDDSGAVTFDDLVQLLAQWGPCAYCPADLDGDFAIGFADLVMLLAHWGGCGQ